MSLNDEIKKEVTVIVDSWLSKNSSKNLKNVVQTVLRKAREDVIYEAVGIVKDSWGETKINPGGLLHKKLTAKIQPLVEQLVESYVEELEFPAGEIQALLDKNVKETIKRELAQYGRSIAQRSMENIYAQQVETIIRRVLNEGDSE